jgi:hypothetical protein
MEKVMELIGLLKEVLEEQAAEQAEKGVEELPDAAKINIAELFIGKYVICRSQKQGVVAGYLHAYDPETYTGVIKTARRIWYWAGACSISQLAQEGIKNHKESKLPVEVDFMLVTNVIEMDLATEAARKNIALCPVWERKE